MYLHTTQTCEEGPGVGTLKPMAALNLGSYPDLGGSVDTGRSLNLCIGPGPDVPIQLVQL